MKKLILSILLVASFTSCVEEAEPQNCLEVTKASHYSNAMSFFEVRDQTTGVYNQIYVLTRETPPLYRNAKVGDILCY
jgi:hypothetical protein